MNGFGLFGLKGGEQISLQISPGDCTAKTQSPAFLTLSSVSTAFGAKVLVSQQSDICDWRITR